MSSAIALLSKQDRADGLPAHAVADIGAVEDGGDGIAVGQHLAHIVGGERRGAGGAGLGHFADRIALTTIAHKSASGI